MSSLYPTADLFGDDSAFEGELKRRGLYKRFVEAPTYDYNRDILKRQMRRMLTLQDMGLSQGDIQSGLGDAKAARFLGIAPGNDLELDRALKDHVVGVEQKEQQRQQAFKTGYNSVLQEQDLQEALAGILDGVRDPDFAAELTELFVRGQHVLHKHKDMVPLARQIVNEVTSGKSFDPANIDSEELQRYALLTPEERERLHQTMASIAEMEGVGEGAEGFFGLVGEYSRNIARVGGRKMKGMGEFFFGQHMERNIREVLSAEDLYIQHDKDLSKELLHLGEGRIYTKDGGRRQINRRKLTPEEADTVRRAARTMQGAIALSRQSGDYRAQLKPLLDDNWAQRAVGILGQSAAEMLLFLNPASVIGIGIPDFISMSEAQLQFRAPDLPLAKRQALAVASGTLEAGIARLQVMTLFGKVPGLSRALQGAGRPFMDAAVRTGVNLPVEIGQEFIEEQTFNTVLAVAGMMDKSLPEAQFAETTKAFVKELGPMALGMLPLVALGSIGGANITPEIAEELQPFLGVNMLKVAGFSQEDISRIHAEQDPVKRTATADEIAKEKGPEAMATAAKEAMQDQSTVDAAKEEMREVFNGGDPSKSQKGSHSLEGEPLARSVEGRMRRDDPSDPQIKQSEAEENVVGGGGPGASDSKEWRVRNAWRRFHMVSEAKDSTGVEDVDKATTGKYVPITNKDTEAQVREKIAANGLVNTAQAWVNGGDLVDEHGNRINVIDDLTEAQWVALGGVLADELVTARQHVKKQGDPEAAEELDELIFDVATTWARWGTKLGQGVQAFRIFSYLRPEAVIGKMDDRLKKKPGKKGKKPLRKGTRKEKEAAKELEEQLELDLNDARKEEEQQEEEFDKWIESIDKNVRGEDRELRNVPPESRPTSDNETIKDVVRRYAQGSAMSDAFLEAEFQRFGFSEEETAEGVLRAGNLRKANDNKRAAQAKKAFIEGLRKREASSIHQQHLDMRRRFNRAEKFVTSIWEEKKEQARPTDDNLTPAKVLRDFLNGAMTPAEFAEQLRAFVDEKTGMPLFLPKQIDEAVVRATADKSERRLKVELRAMRSAAQQYVRGLRDMMGEEGFRKAFLETKDGAARTMEDIMSDIDQAESFNELFDILRAGPGLNAAEKAELLDLSQQVREAPAGFLRDAASRRLVNRMYRLEGIKAADVVTAYWYANILSGFNTHTINAAGSGMHLIARALAAIPVNHPRDVFMMLQGLAHGAKEAGPEFKGALVDGRQVSKFEQKWNVNPEPLEAAAQSESRFVRIVSLWKYVLRALQATDGWFYRTAYEGRVFLAASRVARRESDTNADYARRLAENLHNSTDEYTAARRLAEEQVPEVGVNGQTEKSRERDIRRRAYEIIDARRNEEVREEARNFGLLVTYTQEPEGTLGVLAAAMNQINRLATITTRWGEIPITRPLVPFVNVVTNVANSSLDFSGYGVVRGIMGRHLIDSKDAKMTAQERWERGSAGVLGAGLATAVFQVAQHYLDDDDPVFALYGAGPDNPDKRRQLYARGWRPYTVKIGNVYANYFETPVVIPFAIIGGLHDKKRWDPKFDERSGVERASILLTISAQAYMETGFLSSVSDIFERVSGRGSSARGLGDVLARAAGGLLPARGMVRDLITRPLDPTIVENDGLWASFIRDYPFVQHYGTSNILNGFGEEVERTALQRTPALSRFFSSRTSDPQWTWLARNGLWLSSTPRNVTVGLPSASNYEKRVVSRIKDIRREEGRMAFDVFTVEEAYDYQKIVGPRIREAVRAMSRLHPTVAPDEKETIQENLYDQIRDIRRDGKLELLRRLHPDAF